MSLAPAMTDLPGGRPPRPLRPGGGVLGWFWLFALLLAATLTPRPAAAQSGLGPRECAYVATMSAMAADLRAIDRADSSGAAAPHLQALRRRLRMVTPEMLRAAGQEGALAPHVGTFAEFVAGTARFLASGGHPGAVPGAERTARLAMLFRCPAPAPPAARRDSLANLSSPGGGALHLASASVTPGLVSGVFLGPPRQRQIFYAGAGLLALTVVLVHLRNLRQARLSHRHPCRIEARLRCGRREGAVVIQDLSRLGARIGSGRLSPGTRLWLQLDRVWLSARVAWSTRHCAGLAFAHPIDPQQLTRALDGARRKDHDRSHRESSVRATSPEHVPNAIHATDEPPSWPNRQVEGPGSGDRGAVQAAADVSATPGGSLPPATEDRRPLPNLRAPEKVPSTPTKQQPGERGKTHQARFDSVDLAALVAFRSQRSARMRRGGEGTRRT